MKPMPDHIPTHGENGSLSRMRIDMHSHLLPGIDDGCQNLDDSIECIRMLKEAGYTGSFCTPHVWPDVFPENTPDQICEWTDQLRQQLNERSIQYQIWPGGELRLSESIVEWMKEHGVPTLANSNRVLVDYWGEKWTKWLNPCFEWLIDSGYQPILAHPERIRCRKDLDKRLVTLEQMGVWLQGNFRCITGGEGMFASGKFRQLMNEGRYQLLALDMHGPDSLQSRLDGIDIVEIEFGIDTIRELTVNAPRQLILDA